MEDIGASIIHYLVRHSHGDWGDLCADDKQANANAIKHGGRVLSKYVLSDQTAIYIITEADRRSTTVMLTSEY
jgi:hypothetical protein